LLVGLDYIIYNYHCIVLQQCNERICNHLQSIVLYILTILIYCHHV